MVKYCYARAGECRWIRRAGDTVMFVGRVNTSQVGSDRFSISRNAIRIISLRTSCPATTNLQTTFFFGGFAVRANMHRIVVEAR